MPVPVPYLFFNGNCAEALAAYAELLGGDPPELMWVRDLPIADEMPEATRDMVMHARLAFPGGELMASDDIMGDTPAMAGASLLLNYPTAAEARSVYDRLAEGGQAQMPFAATFWSAGFGTLTDRFGTQWMIGCDEAPKE